MRSTRSLKTWRRSGGSCISSPSPSTGTSAARPGTWATRSPTPRGLPPSRWTERSSACGRPAWCRPTRPTRGRRQRIQEARLEATERLLNPLLLQTVGQGPRACGRPGVPRLHGAVLHGQGSRLPAPAGRAGGVPHRVGGRLRALHGPSHARPPGRQARRPAVLGPAVSVAGAGVRPRLHRRAPGPGPARHARRHGYRPRRAGERAPRHGGQAAQVAAGVLLPGQGAGRDLPRGLAARRPGRLRRPVPRGGAHRALRARRA